MILLNVEKGASDDGLPDLLIGLWITAHVFRDDGRFFLRSGSMPDPV